MINLHKLMYLFGLDFNIEAQTGRFLRISAEGSYASRQTRFLAAHDLSATDYVSPWRSRN